MPTTTLQQQARALGDPTRHAIFEHLAQAGRAVGVAELNAEFPLNHNAIRQHLAKLVPAVHRRWGADGPYERLSRLLVTAMARQGFEPDVRSVRGGAEIVLRDGAGGTGTLSLRGRPRAR